jgi:hypothetical protein
MKVGAIDLLSSTILLYAAAKGGLTQQSGERAR